MAGKLIKITVFETVDELSEITGLSSDELWAAGFNLDDWDIGFCCNQKLHRKPTKPEMDEYDMSENEMVFTDKAHWLTFQMSNYCAGPSFVQHKNKYYYLVHHS